MAIVTTVPHLYPEYEDMNSDSTTAGYTAITLNASGDRMAYVIQVPKTGTLDKFEFMTDTVGNNPDNGIRLSFQDIDLATGFPDGTQDQYRDITGTISTDTWQVPGLMTADGTDLGAKRSVTAGDMLGCVVDFVTFVALDSFGTRYLSKNTNNVTSSINYIANAATGTYARVNGTPNIALKYDDGTYAQGVTPIGAYTALTSTNVSSTTTPDELGMLFQVPMSCRVAGVWARMDINDNVDFVLYDSGSTAQRTLSVDANTVANSAGLFTGYFSSTIDLTATSNYRIVLKPSTATNNNLQVRTLPGSAYLTGQPGGSSWYQTSRTDAGAWTDDNTKVVPIGLIVTGYDSGSGGGTGGSFTFIG